jgi:predicted enzyme related to lactoylglutathione lyase
MPSGEVRHFVPLMTGVTVNTEGRSTRAGGTQSSESLDMPLEVLVVPVSDVDRAKGFYATLGWRLDTDRGTDGFRLIQFTPPGSECSVQFGTGLTAAAPGSSQGLVLTVADIQAAREALIARGANVSQVFHCASGTACRFKDGDGLYERASGPAPDHTSYGSFAAFSDPDGNGWLLQEVTARLPGRIDPERTSFGSAHDLADAMTRAAAAHGEHEKRIGKADPDWPDWYATHMVAEQAGAGLPR